MSYQEMTRAEWDAITERLGGADGWRTFYNSTRPPWWRPWRRFLFDRAESNMALRRKCVQYGGFDPADVVRVTEL